MRTIALVLFTLTIIQPAHAFELINPLSVIANVVEAAVEDRSSSDIAADTKLKVDIVATISNEMGSDIASVSTDVYEQDVMLTGVVETGKQKAQAGKIAQNAKTAKKVHNEILVIAKTDEGKGAVEGFVDDTVIEKKINALLLDAKGVNVTNFRWRAVGGHAFLFGRALSKAELTKAVAVVKDIKGVSKVTARVKVRAK